MNSEAAPSSAGAAAAAVLPEEPVSLVVEEKLAVVLNKDGGLESMEVQGTMSLQVSLGARRRPVILQSMGAGGGGGRVTVEVSLGAGQRPALVQSMEGHVSVEVHYIISLHSGMCCCVLIALAVEVQGTIRLPVRPGLLAGQ